MIYYNKHSSAFLLALTITLAACSSQPSYEGKNIEQSLEQHSQWHYSQDSAQQATYITDLVNIKELEPLIEQALLNNPSYNQVHVALKLAYAQRDVTSASRWFNLNTDFNAQKNESTDTQYSSALNVSWEADLWQKIADNVAAQDMAIASSQATMQSAKDTLVASVIRTYFNIVLRQNLLNIEQQRLHVLQNNELSIVERYQYGLGDLEALDTARSSTASTRAVIADYQEQIAQTKRALVLLVGVDKIAAFPQTSVFPEVIEPLSTLPAQDLARRPDLQSAYYTIQQKRFLVDVSYKELLPSISLSASLTDLASTPSQALFTSPVWNLLGSISAPLFQGGALRAQVDVAKLNAEQAYWEYQDTLLSAVNEVENALGQEQSLTKQQLQISNVLASAKRSFSNYQSKYQQGLVDILDLLTVQQQVYDLQAQLSQINYTLLTNRIDLGLALGLGVSS